MHKLLLVLTSNIGKLTTYPMIEEGVYMGDPISKVAMQNLVGNLRRDLDIEIKSIASEGYVLYEDRTNQI